MVNNNIFNYCLIVFTIKSMTNGPEIVGNDGGYINGPDIVELIQ